MTIYIDRTLIEGHGDTNGREGDIIHVKKNNSVILDIYMNSPRNSVTNYFTSHHTITTSYRYSRKSITKSYSMIDERGGGE